MKIKKKCSFCGKQFYAQMITTKYCSHSCNQQHYRVKKKKEKLKNRASTVIRKIDEITYESEIIKIQTQDYLSIKDVSALLGISRSTINRLLKNQSIKHIKFGSRVLIRKSELDQLLIDQTPTSINIKIPITGNNKNRNPYFYTKENPDYYDISIRSLDRHLKKNNIEKYRDGRDTFILKNDIEKILGKPTKTPESNG